MQIRKTYKYTRLFNTISIFSILLLTITFLLFITPIKTLQNTSYDYKHLKAQYNSSQIVLGSDATTVMFDAELYTYAGVTYLTQGQLDEINIEHPPLGKYLYGISAITTNEPVLIQIILGYLSILLLYFICTAVFRSPITAVIPPLILITDKLFITETSHNELDIPLLFFILLFLLLYIKSKNIPSRVWVVLGIILGCVASVKYPSAAIILYASVLIHQLYQYTLSSLKKTVMFGLVAVLTYVTFYTPLLIDKGALTFINVHEQALRMHLSHLPNYPPLAAFRVIFTSQWPVWFDTIRPLHQVQQWSMLWPLSVMCLFISVYLCMFRQYKNLLPLLIFSILYLVFINLRLFFPRYLALFLPFGYIGIGVVVDFVISKVKHNQHPYLRPR